jgi:hypothetical protein
MKVNLPECLPPCTNTVLFLAFQYAYFDSEPAITFDAADFPESYQVNNNKEKLVLAYAENFRRQYVHLFRDRKPLFLNPLNELEIEVHSVMMNV